MTQTISITEEQFVNMIEKRIEEHSTPQRWVANRADPTSCSRIECLVAFGDSDGENEYIVRRFEVTLVDSIGVEITVFERACNMRTKALFDYQDREFVRNAAWQTDATIDTFTDLLADGIWYGKNDREPSEEQLFS